MKQRVMKFMKNKMIYSTPVVIMPTAGDSVKGFQGDILSVLPGIGIILLVLTLYFVSASIKTYGGKIGHSLNIIGIGMFVVAIKELFYFSSLVAYGSYLTDLLSNASFVHTFNYTTNIVIFAFFSYGFYSMTKVFENNSKKK